MCVSHRETATRARTDTKRELSQQKKEAEELLKIRRHAGAKAAAFVCLSRDENVRNVEDELA